MITTKLRACLFAFAAAASAFGASVDDDFADLSRRAGEAHERKDYDEAVRLYTQALAVCPETFADGCYFGRAWAYIAQGANDKAIADLSRAIDLVPKSLYYGNRGRARAAKGDVRAALADYDAAVSLEPGVSVWYFVRGMLRQQVSDFDGAIGDYTRTIWLDRKHENAYLSRALCYQGRLAYEQAIADCDSAVVLNPKNAWAYFQRADRRARVGEFPKALSDLAKAIDIDAGSAPFHQLRGDVRSAMRDWLGAEADYATAIGLDPKDPALYYGRARIFKAHGKIAAAVADFRAAIRLAPDVASSWNELAWIEATSPEAGLRDGRAAVEHAKKACEITQWKDWNCLDTLAAAYAEAGAYEDAAAWQRKAVALGRTLPGFAEEGKPAEERLKLYEKQQPYRDR